MNDSLRAMVSLVLDPDPERYYSLPGGGSRSMLFVFGGRQIGAVASSASGDFVPGSAHPSVSLAFWDDAVSEIVKSDATFDVWYDDVIGTGRVASVSWSESR